VGRRRLLSCRERSWASIRARRPVESMKVTPSMSRVMMAAPVASAASTAASRRGAVERSSSPSAMTTRPPSRSTVEMVSKSVIGDPWPSVRFLPKMSDRRPRDASRPPQSIQPRRARLQLALVGLALGQPAGRGLADEGVLPGEENLKPDVCRALEDAPFLGYSTDDLEAWSFDALVADPLLEAAPGVDYLTSDRALVDFDVELDLAGAVEEGVGHELADGEHHVGQDGRLECGDESVGYLLAGELAGGRVA